MHWPRGISDSYRQRPVSVWRIAEALFDLQRPGGDVPKTESDAWLAVGLMMASCVTKPRGRAWSRSLSSSPCCGVPGLSAVAVPNLGVDEEPPRRTRPEARINQKDRKGSIHREAVLSKSTVTVQDDGVVL